MSALPLRVVARCRSVNAVSLPCPLRAPTATTASFDVVSFGNRDSWTFSAQVGAPGSTNVRPPQFVHLALQAGDLATTFQAFTYSRTAVVQATAGILTRPERLRLERLGLHGEIPEGLYFGKRTWGGKAGDLVLVPEFEYSETIHGGHLLFTWHVGKIGYAVSLHAWEPFPQTVSALQDVIESISA
jgi:hypothetical protein